MKLMKENGDPNTKGIIGVILIIIGLITGISMIFASFETIQAGERGIVLYWGAVDETLDEGFHMINPISKKIVVMNVKVQKIEAKAAAASKDLQTVTSTVALNYHISPEGAAWLYQNVGRDYELQIIQPAIQESVKAGTADFTAEELISKRPEVKDKIRTVLLERLDGFSLIVDDFSIVNFDFSTEFNNAIEAKQVAVQQALQAENDLDRIKLEAQQQIEQAKAQAESTRLQADALKESSEVIELRKAEAMLEMAKRWDGSMPQYMLGDGGALPLFNLN